MQHFNESGQVVGMTLPLTTLSLFNKLHVQLYIFSLLTFIVSFLFLCARHELLYLAVRKCQRFSFQLLVDVIVHGIVTVSACLSVWTL